MDQDLLSQFFEMMNGVEMIIQRNLSGGCCTPADEHPLAEERLWK